MDKLAIEAACMEALAHKHTTKATFWFKFDLDTYFTYFDRK